MFSNVQLVFMGIKDELHVYCIGKYSVNRDFNELAHDQSFSASP